MRLIVAVAVVVCTCVCGWAQEAPKVHIGPGGELIVGGFDPTSFETAAQSAKSFEDSVPKLKMLGVTSHENYVRWNLCEVAAGKWDWSVYDRYVEIYKKNGLKWVPFLICGSPYSLPDWYYKKEGFQGYVCLEHGEESDVQSLWNPAMRQHVAEFIKAFCEHYRDGGAIESILLGVSGNYGECLYPVTGNDWTADRHGKYHSHPGFWAGDPFAVKDFAASMKKKYATSEKLKSAWSEKAPAIDEVKPFLKKDAPNDRAWIDFTDWYTGSMTDYAWFWMRETRKNFPDGEIDLCTGGHAPPEHGADFGDQCKVASEFNGGVRITNEGSDYAKNFTYTRWVAAAGELYGAYYGFEPAGGVDGNGIVGRVYNASASGCKGLHYYWGNLFDVKGGADNFIRTGAMFQQNKPQVEIAVYYPTTQIKLVPKVNDFVYKTFLGAAEKLRDRFDFNFVSDHMIADGALKNYRVLVVVAGDTAEKSTWEAIGKWSKGGGLFLYPLSLKTVEGETVNGAVDGIGPLGFDSDANRAEFRMWVSDEIRTKAKLSEAARRAVMADDKEDKVFATLLKDGRVLWYNANTTEATTASGVKIDGASILAEGPK